MEVVPAHNLGYLGAAEARRQPDKVAIIELAGEAVRQRSHGELQRRLDQVAALLQGLGRVRDVRQGPDGYIYLAIENRGGALTPIVRLEPVN